MTFPHWIAEEYFQAVVSKDEFAANSALDKLVDDIQTNKRATTTHLLSSNYGDAVISNLILWLQSASSRVAGNAAFVLGSVAEDRHGCLRIIDAASRNNSEGVINFPDTLVSLLISNDTETVLNAAGTLGTIAESDEGREWLLDSVGDFSSLILYIDKLLQSSNRWIASNAALVLARLTISDRGLHLIVNYPESSDVLSHLIDSVGVDEAGCGMNCAFTLGRICDSVSGMKKILGAKNKDNLLFGLSSMLSAVPTGNADTGLCKNACFCFSCIAATDEGHRWMVQTPNFLLNEDQYEMCDWGDKKDRETVEERSGFPGSLTGNRGVLVSMMQLLTLTDTESAWFAAMAIRSLISHPRGLIIVRRCQMLINALKNCLISPRASEELQNEVEIVMRQLGPLPQAPKPKVIAYAQTSALVRWTALDSPGLLPVAYALYFQADGSQEPKLVYTGTNLETRVKDLRPYTRYIITLCGRTEVEQSPLSEPTILLTEEATPSAPTNLCAATVTTTQVRLVWDPPKKLNGVLRYYMVRVERLDRGCANQVLAVSRSQKKYQVSALRYSERTNEPTTIISGLLPQTFYSISVCAVNGRGIGPSASTTVKTLELGPHCPSKPVISALGRSEVTISWEPPKVTLGRISRYEVHVNKQKSPVFSGTGLSCRLVGLRPDTDYVFTVTLVTNMGKFESKPSRKHTAKDEYACPPRVPLYNIRGREGRHCHSGRSSVASAGRKRTACPRKVISGDVNTGRAINSNWNPSVSVPSLGSDLDSRDLGSRGDRAPFAVPVRTFSTPAVRGTQSISPKPVLRRGQSQCIVPFSSPRTSHTRSPRSTIQHHERRANSAGPCSRNSKSEERSLSSVRRQTLCYGTSKESLEKELCEENAPTNTIAQSSLTPEAQLPISQIPVPVKRSSGFWRFGLDMGNYKRRSSSTSIQTFSDIERASNSESRSQIVSNLYSQEKKVHLKLFRRSFWNRRHSSNMDNLHIVTMNDTPEHQHMMDPSKRSLSHSASWTAGNPLKIKFFSTTTRIKQGEVLADPSHLI
ncbi:unnamed protein product [Calicophoron daubneyi]|uniref:Fibronectin type-III domain-containing protein n=1 Tax=Calicophoron daubneyi TaxID=300641 RepID=A0AAV2TRY1_CALDB